MALNTLSLQHTNKELASGEPFVCERLNKAGKGACVAVILLVFNIVMLLSGALEDAFKLEALLSDDLITDSLLVVIAQFLAHPIIANQLLIGLCWLLFHIIPARRAGIILRKTAFAFQQAKSSVVVHSAHGCRAPPQVNS